MIRPAISALILAAGLAGMASAQEIHLADGKDYTRSTQTQPAPLRAQTTTRSGANYGRTYSNGSTSGATDQRVYTTGSSRNLAGGSYSGGTTYRYGAPSATHSGSGSYTRTRPANTHGRQYHAAPARSYSTRSAPRTTRYSASGRGSQLSADGRDTHVYIRGDNCNGRNAHDSGALVGNITGGTRYHCTASAASRSVTSRRTYSAPATSYTAPRQSYSTQTYRAPRQTYSSGTTYSSGQTYSTRPVTTRPVITRPVTRNSGRHYSSGRTYRSAPAYSGRSYSSGTTYSTAPRTSSYPTRSSANRSVTNTQYPTSSNYSRQSYVSGQRWPTQQTYSAASYPTSYGTSYGTTFTPGAYTGGVGANVTGGYYGGGGAVIINNSAPRFSGVTQHTFGANTVTVHRGAAIAPGHHGGHMGGHHGGGHH